MGDFTSYVKKVRKENAIRIIWVSSPNCQTSLLSALSNSVCLTLLWLQKLYIVCDVALFVIANKSTACHLDSPKDPVLPSKFFLIQDKAIHATHTHTRSKCSFPYGIGKLFQKQTSDIWSNNTYSPLGKIVASRHWTFLTLHNNDLYPLSGG